MNNNPSNEPGVRKNKSVFFPPLAQSHSLNVGRLGGRLRLWSLDWNWAQLKGSSGRRERLLAEPLHKQRWHPLKVCVYVRWGTQEHGVRKEEVEEGEEVNWESPLWFRRWVCLPLNENISNHSGRFTYDLLRKSERGDSHSFSLSPHSPKSVVGSFRSHSGLTSGRQKLLNNQQAEDY